MNRKNLLHLHNTFLRITNITTDQFKIKAHNATEDDLALVESYRLLMVLLDEQIGRNTEAQRRGKAFKLKKVTFRDKLISKLRSK